MFVLIAAETGGSCFVHIPAETDSMFFHIAAETGGEAWPADQAPRQAGADQGWGGFAGGADVAEEQAEQGLPGTQYCPVHKQHAPWK